MNDDRNEQANQIIIGALLDIKAQLDRLETTVLQIQAEIEKAGKRTS